MDPAPQDHHADNPSAGQAKKEGIDPKSLLLPKKEVPGATVQSAQRINAGALLEQELAAGAQGIPAAQKPEAPAPVPAPKKEEAVTQSLETYKSDIEKLVQDKNVSVVSIAAAEAQRRSATGDSGEPKEPLSAKIKTVASRTTMIIGGAALLLIAASLVWYFFLRSVPINSLNSAAPTSPFIAVDGTQVIPVSAAQSRTTIMGNLEGALQSTTLSLGLVERLLPEEGSTTPQGQTLVPMNAAAFLPLIAPDIPQDLLLTVQPNFLLGVHVYNGDQPLLILSVDSYEQAYSDMLAWEPTMQSDLMPLFNYTPSPTIPEQSIATSSSNTEAQFSQSSFVDAIVENHDARVREDSTGDIVLLWTFIDRNTIVITTNDATLHEVISRLENAPVTPIPGQ